MDGVLIHLFAPDVPVQLIAADDIGAFAALAFNHPAAYLGESLEIAGDELTPLQTVSLISSVLDREITYRQVPIDDAAGLGGDAARAFANRRGLWRADIPALRERHPDLLGFPAWLKRGGAARIEKLLTAAATA
ncbi:NmrA family NAD(P)-binding protein [Actinopolymorpha pittospori]|uniref:Uncharacterized protein YbjT (DUF2867 family) n=1 Tax=Actinopolymorpha pittospori TaxID=648752 RepID=A0A927MR74_9ACTN|nr:uncharacterized protein YbjT (DUF2867 family) [Actinopolymorpha pittospori]